jgi:hypothetical protein
MKNGWIKIVGITALVIFLGAGMSFAGGRDCDNGRNYGHGYGYYQGNGHHPHGPYYRPGYHYYAPRPHYPVVVERRYYPAPPRVVYPSPGFYFGMSAVQPGVSFGIGVQGY